MSVPRVYHPGLLIVGQEILLSKAVTHHLCRVLHLQSGEMVQLFPGDGSEFDATLISRKKNSLCVRIDRQRENIAVTTMTSVRLLIAVTRSEKMDFILQKATELGVTAILPAVSMRSEPHRSAEQWHQRLPHWQQIIIHATEQCGRTRLPILYPPQTLMAVLEATRTQNASETAGQRFILDPRSSQRLSQQSLLEGQITAAVGPEGGFTEEELAIAIRAGFCSVTLGPRLLRVETAAIAVVALLQALIGDL